MGIKKNMKSNDVNDLFDYGYLIYQNSDFFKFSIDSVLLAEFVSVKKGKREILDLCSGNAPIPMILHNKFGSRVHITGIELQDAIYDLGVLSLRENEIDTVEYIKGDVNDLLQIFPKRRFDIITCNPPYFAVSDTNLKNVNNIKAIARHEIMIDLDNLVKMSSKVINNQGYFCMVHRATRIADIINCLHKYNFGIKRLVPVYDNHGSQASLVLIEAIYNGKDYVTIEKAVYLKDYKSYKNIFDEVRK